MRVWPLLVILMLPGCVSELIGPPEVTTRTVTCASLAPDMQVRVLHHVVSDAVPADIRDLAVETWMQEMAAITGKTDAHFMVEEGEALDHEGPWDYETMRPWVRGQTVLTSSEVVLRILWVNTMPEPGRAVEPLAPGFLLINTTAWTLAVTEGHDGVVLAQVLVYHGLGHLLGVVNRGVPLSDPHGAAREEPQHHEPGGVMDADWHHRKTFSKNVTIAYSEGLVADWRHAQTSPAVCA